MSASRPSRCPLAPPRTYAYGHVRGPVALPRPRAGRLVTKYNLRRAGAQAGRAVDVDVLRGLQRAAATERHRSWDLFFGTSSLPTEISEPEDEAATAERATDDGLKVEFVTEEDMPDAQDQVDEADDEADEDDGATSNSTEDAGDWFDAASRRSRRLSGASSSSSSSSLSTSPSSTGSDQLTDASLPFAAAAAAAAEDEALKDEHLQLQARLADIAAARAEAQHRRDLTHEHGRALAAAEPDSVFADDYDLDERFAASETGGDSESEDDLSEDDEDEPQLDELDWSFANEAECWSDADDANYTTDSDTSTDN
ncbi:hypothetical protein JCM8097_007649 [Rhodosporidiobolus ruineniae]